MKTSPARIATLLAGAWSAVARAFTNSRAEPDSQGNAADTTLFGSGPEGDEAGRADRPRKSGFWGLEGESSYLADDEDGNQRPQRR